MEGMKLETIPLETRRQLLTCLVGQDGSLIYCWRGQALVKISYNEDPPEWPRPESSKMVFATVMPLVYSRNSVPKQVQFYFDVWNKS
jgi:hypothetical protein